MRILSTLGFLVAGSVPAAAQCQIAWFQPPSFTPASGAFTAGTAVLAGNMRVRVYERTPGGWIDGGGFGVQGMPIFHFDPIVDLDTDRIAAGFVEGDGLVGEVTVFVRSSGWSSEAVLHPSDPTGVDAFGSGVALSGDVLAIGASNELFVSGAGKVFVFERVAGAWTETASFVPHGYTSLTIPAYGVEMDNDGQAILVGSPSDDEQAHRSGAVYVYEKVAGVWQEVAKLFASSPTADQGFGRSVSVDGQWAAIGAVGPQGQAVHLFQRTVGGWVPRQVLADGSAGDAFGASVSIAGDFLAVGAPGTDPSVPYKTNVGAVRAYRRRADQWSEILRVVAEDAPDHARFGSRVALSGNQVMWMGVYQSVARLNSLGVTSVAQGCTATPNSTGSRALLSASGCDSVLADSLTLHAAPVPFGRFGWFLVSDSAASIPFGNGLLCLGPARALSQGPAHFNVLETTIDFGRPPANLLQPGRTWHVQAVFRDPVGAGFNTSDSLGIVLEP